MMMRNKRGGANKWVIIGIVLLVVWIGIVVLVQWKNWSTTLEQLKIARAENYRLSQELWQKSGIWGKTKIIFTKTPEYISDWLGFKDDWAKLEDFFHYFWIGLWAGLWIYIINMLIRLQVRFFPGKEEIEKKKYKGGWLYLIGGQIWKVLVIAVVYGIAMLIPIVHAGIKIITFEVLMPNSVFILSFIIAFYIGFLPAAIERFYRYRLRMKYYKQLMNVKYGVKMAKAMSSG